MPPILKAKYTSKDDMPAWAIDLYEERGDELLLKRDAIEGVKTQGDVDRINEALRKERSARSDAEAKLKKFDALGDADPEDLLKARDEVEELRARLEAGEGGKTDEATVQKRIDAAVARETNPLRRELDKYKGEAEKYRGEAETLAGTIRKTSLESQLSKEAAALGVRPEAIPDILRYQDVFEQDDAGAFRTRDNVGVTPGLDVKLFIEEMKETRQHWWPTSTGGGAKGSDGAGPTSGNPFSKTSPNFTEANRLVRTDRAKAEQYARAAGYASISEAAAAMAKADAAR